MSSCRHCLIESYRNLTVIVRSRFLLWFVQFFFFFRYSSSELSLHSRRLRYKCFSGGETYVATVKKQVLQCRRLLTGNDWPCSTLTRFCHLQRVLCFLCFFFFFQEPEPCAPNDVTRRSRGCREVYLSALNAVFSRDCNHRQRTDS